MIYTEMLGETMIRHYTDNKQTALLQKETGDIYEDAVDVYPCPYTYEEVENPYYDGEDEEVSSEEALLILLGEEEG